MVDSFRLTHTPAYCPDSLSISVTVTAIMATNGTPKEKEKTKAKTDRDLDLANSVRGVWLVKVSTAQHSIGDHDHTIVLAGTQVYQ